jgi:hypothetical protein
MEVSLLGCSYKYIVGSGWWCGDDSLRLKHGDNLIRQSGFHDIWMRGVETFCNPEKIIIVDSNSPIKPNVKDGIEFLSLNQNAGHSTNLKKGEKYCGWSASVLLSMHYALHCDCDYFVYIEQDCLLYGDGVIEKQIEHMNSNGLDLLYGSGDNTFQPVQVSFFVVKKSYIEKLISKYFSINSDDSELSPEFKLNMVYKRVAYFIPEIILKNKVVNYVLSKIKNRHSMTIGYGRERPIDFNDDYFYFQQGSAEEINDYLKLLDAYDESL